MINFIIVACRISSRLKRYKNYKNQLSLANIIVKNKVSRFYGSLCTYSTYMYIRYIRTALFLTIQLLAATASTKFVLLFLHKLYRPFKLSPMKGNGIQCFVL